METFTLTIRPDGLVKIPGTRPGQIVTVTVELVVPEPPPLSELSPDEQERQIQRLLEGGRRVRELADPEWLELDHGDWLYGPDGLPR